MATGGVIDIKFVARLRFFTYPYVSLELDIRSLAGL